MGGLIGVTIGLVFAVLAASWTVRSNRRAGSTHPVADALGFGVTRSTFGVERAATRDAARLAYPLFALFSVIYVFATGGGTAAGVLAGTAGAIYGCCTALAARRLGR